MPELWGKTLTRIDLLKRVGDMRQMADVWPFELSEGNERGTRGVAMRNAGGLSFRVLSDRGMGLYDLQFHGVPISFMSGAGAVHPAYTDPAGMGWLDTWPGGFMTTCGLTQVGSPCVDEGEELGLHGRVASIPSEKVSWGAEWQANDYVLWVAGSLPRDGSLCANRPSAQAANLDNAGKCALLGGGPGRKPGIQSHSTHVPSAF